MDIKRYLTDESLAMAIFGIAALVATGRGHSYVILVGLAVAFMVFGALPKQHVLAFLAGALAIVMAQRYESTVEGFTDVSGQNHDESVSEAENSEETDNEKKEIVKPDPVAIEAEKKSAEKFSGSKKKVMLPDNATRREPLELGKPYKLPSENDDKGYHLDSGTTFLNAYKALKPDQIAAMTRDTQELLATQKSLVGMLESFGPLMKDMKSITGIFGSSGN